MDVTIVVDELEEVYPYTLGGLNIIFGLELR